MAEKAQSYADRQGWLYLHDMLLKWQAGKTNTDPFASDEPFWIPWNWLMNYRRFLEKYAIIKDPGYLFSPNAKGLLVERLKRDEKFSDSQVEFNYISQNWRNWKQNYFQSILVDTQLMPIGMPDGMTASIATFRIYALASGHTSPAIAGHKITIENAALVVIDSFNFQGDQGYGYWRCNPPEFEWRAHSITDISFTEMTNEILNAFAIKYSVGHEFLVLSGPKDLEIESEMVYESDI